MTTNSPRSRQKAFHGKSSGDDDWQEDYSASNNNSHGAMMMMASTILQSPRNNNRDENAPDEITVPTYSHRRGNNESSGRHLYDDSVPLDQYRDPTMTSGSHSSSMTNPNSPHSPLHNISFTLPSYHDDSDSPPLDSIPLLPPRHGLLERRRSSRNHLDHAANSSSNNLAKTISSSSFLVMTTDYSSSGDEAALDATTLASQRRRHSRKWRQRKSLGAAAAPASNVSSTRRQLRQRSQSTLQQQQQQSSSSLAPWPCRLLCGNSKSSGRRNSVMWLLLVVVGGLSISLTIATNTRIREQQRETILLLQQKVPGDMAIIITHRFTTF